MADNKYTSAINEIKLGIKSIIAEMEIADKKIVELANSASKIGNSFKTNTPDGLNNALKEQTYLLKLLSAELESQRKNTDRLGDAKKKLIVLTGQEKINNRQLAKNADLYTQSTSKLVGAYGNLIAKQKMAKKALQDLIAAEKQNTKQIKNAQREYDRYTARVNKAKQATSNFAKNSLGGMVRGFQNLIGAFGVVLGAQGIVGLIKNVFETIKTIEKLEFTLSTVTKSVSEFNATQLFLSDITQRFGIDLVTTTERFTKFLAAANQSNISFEETTRIFEGVSKAASVLGLRTDELSGVYLALEQMLSKGKVTTEELRRQLGERLPGAVGIMAKALGVTTSELDKMLKKGEVLSADALPKFAKALEEAYNLGTVETVDTLVAAQQRLSNSWIMFVDTVNTSEGKLTSVFKRLINFATSTIEGWEKIIKTTGELNLDRINKANVESFKQAEIYATGILKRNGEFGTTVLQQMIDDQNKLVERQKQSITAITDSANGNKLILNEETKKRVQEMEVTLGEYTGTLDAYNKVLTNTVKKEEEDLEIKEKKGIQAVKGSIGYLEQLISKLEEERKKLATNSDEYRNYTIQIENAQNALAKLRHELEDQQKVEGISFGDSEDILDDYNKMWDGRFEKAKEINDQIRDYQQNKRKEELQEAEAHYQELDNIVKTTFDTFAEYYDLDLDNFTFLYDNKENKLEDWMTAFDSVIDSALDASLNRYDIELQAAQRNRDLIVNNELATEKEKRIAREKFEEEERRIKTERAKKERQNTLIQIAVDTARGAILAYLSQLIPGDPTSIPRAFGAAAVTTGFGLAQAALVASQPIPEFAEGTKAPLAEDTLAVVGDGGRKEAITENGKLVGVTPDKPTLMNLKKGQEVQKDAKSWIDNAVYRMNMESNGEMLSSVMMDNIMHDEMKKMRAESKRTWEEVKKLASRPINVSNRVIVESKMNEYKQ